MSREPFFKKIRRLFCMGPFILFTIFFVEIVAFLLKQFFPMVLGLTLPVQVILSIVFGMIFVSGYAWFLLMLGRHSMGKRIIKSGPYRIVRHPLYATFSLTIPAVIVVWCNDAWFILSWILIVIIAHFVIKVEEKILIDKFGKDYLDYRQKVPALIPYKGVVKL